MFGDVLAAAVIALSSHQLAPVDDAATVCQ